MTIFFTVFFFFFFFFVAIPVKFHQNLISVKFHLFFTRVRTGNFADFVRIKLKYLTYVCVLERMGKEKNI